MAPTKKKSRKAQGITASIVVIVVIMLIVPVGTFLWGLIGVHIDYSDGVRSVNVIKLSEKGLIWKTYEGEGVLSQEGFAVTYVWNFSVDKRDPNREQIWSSLQTAFEEGRTVTVEYDQRAGKVPWRSKTTYFVKGVQFE